MVNYTVGCTFESAVIGDAWLGWLQREHLAEVCAAGALSAEVVKLIGPEVRYQVHYRFASWEDFHAYEADHAPRLRAAGLERFPLALGLRYERTVGDVMARYPA